MLSLRGLITKGLYPGYQSSLKKKGTICFRKRAMHKLKLVGAGGSDLKSFVMWLYAFIVL